MPLEIDLLYFLIVACEILFWVFLGLGLVLRYIFRLQRLSTFVLYCVPLVDLLLLLFSAIDLYSGAQATFAHGLAAAYVGFTVAFGPPMIASADRWFAHKFADGPEPPKAPEFGWQAVWYELKYWFRCIAAVAIIYILLGAVYGVIDDRTQLAALEIWFKLPLFTIAVWFIFGPLWSLVFFKREKRDATE